MDKKTVITVVVVVIITLALAPTIRSKVPFANKIPTV